MKWTRHKLWAKSTLDQERYWARNLNKRNTRARLNTGLHLKWAWI